MKNLSLSLLFFISFLPLSCISQKKEIFTQQIDWKFQVDSLLMPFWTHKDALGSPLGNFPTYRCNDGSLSNCNELNDVDIQSDYLRMKSRQLYAYCVAYHLTGNEIYLEYATLGVNYLMKHGEYETGCPVTFWQNGKSLPSKNKRNSQDLAYSLNGLAMYYYLTKDENVLNAIIKVKNYIFSEYYDKSIISENSKIFMWVKEDFENEKTSNKELVAILDQLNSYLLLITPLLSDSIQVKFKNDLRNLCYLMKDNFYDKDLNIFWGKLDNKKIGLGEHTDFGHTIKTFWMCNLVGKLINNSELIKFSKENSIKLLKDAYIENTGSWGDCYLDSTKQISKNKTWWIYAELDQMCATLGLQDTSMYSQYLIRTYKYWDNYFIDKINKEVWNGVNENGEPDDKSIPKIHLWKNGYHSMEHALIGYLSTSNYTKNKITLFYAYNKKSFIDKTKINPYYFTADIIDLKQSSFVMPALKSLQKATVIFDNIK